MDEKRLRYLDYARGFSMILVMYAHFFTVKESPLRLWIYSFHIPIFFIITGILIYKKKSSLDVKKQFKNLMVPYYVFCFINIIGLSILDFINEKLWIDNAIINFKNTFLFLGVKANWFLPCLFIGMLVFYFIKNKIEKKENIILIMILLLFIPYFKVDMGGVPAYRIICRSLIATVYLFSGCFIGETIDKIEIKKYKLLLLFFGSLICTSVLGHVDLCYLQLSDPLMYFISAIIGSLFIILLFKYMDEKNIKFKLLEFIGKNSLIFLGTHMVLGYYVRKVLSIIMKTNYIVPNLYLNGFIVLIIVLLIEVLGIIIYNFIKKKVVGGCLWKRKK